MPNLFVIAGPNGAGKSTSAPELLRGARRVDEFVNADVIAKETNVSDIAAGRMTLHRLTELANARKDVAFETTLSSHMLLPRIRAMQQTGYLFHLVFFWIPDADLAVQRVAARVRSGGHAIPEEVIRRRYERGLVNFFNAYAPAADSWLLVDNTGRPPPRRIAWRDVGDRIYVGDNPLWTKLSARYMKPHVEEQKAQPAPERAFTSEELIDAIDRAVRAALARHKALGQSVVVWRDGKIVWVTPEEIEL